MEPGKRRQCPDCGWWGGHGVECPEMQKDQPRSGLKENPIEWEDASPEALANLDEHGSGRVTTAQFAPVPTKHGGERDTAPPLSPAEDICGDGSVLKRILREGRGAQPTNGASVSVNYVGTFADGRLFDKGKGFVFTLGTGVIQGWNDGVATMKIGEHAHFILQPSKGYGTDGSLSGSIPPNTEIHFDIELLEWKGSKYTVPLEVGQAVQVCGLQARSDLNGETGILVRFEEDRGRWFVRLDSGRKSVRVKSTNLCKIIKPASNSYIETEDSDGQDQQQDTIPPELPPPRKLDPQESTSDDNDNRTGMMATALGALGAAVVATALAWNTDL